MNTQTLAQWSEFSPSTPQQHPGGALWVAIGPLTEPKYWSLWMLSDYRVSSVSGGSVWLVKR
jgi:hypothetical protein